MTPALRAILFGQRPWSYMDWFRSSEQGAVYEADNPADGGPVTAYVENTGITPVTAPGQGAADCVIGFLKDKRLGDERGPELFSDGELSAATGWTLENGWSVSGGKLRYAVTGTGRDAHKAVTTTAGRWYEVTFTIDSMSAGQLGAYSLESSNATSAAFSASIGARRYLFAATGASMSIRIRTSAAGSGDIVIDNISVRELPGNHATQATTASKPVLTARYNLLTQTEAFDNAVWLKPNITVAAGKLVEAATTAAHIAYVSFSSVAASYTARVKFKAAERTISYIGLYDGAAGTTYRTYFNLATGAVATSDAGNTGSIQALGDGWYLCSVVRTMGASAASQIHVGMSSADNVSSYLGDITKGLYATQPDLRTSADAALSIPAYQRVTDASNYDTSGFPCFFRWDGFDDSSATAAMDLTGTDKLTVVAGLHKSSDAASAIVAELSANVGAANGAFWLAAPPSAGATYGFASKGTTQATATGNAAAPHTAVLTAVGDISSDISSLRMNGVVAQTTTTDQGTGNYGNHVLNLGRRNGASLPFSGRIYTMIICGAARSASQIAQAERYVARKMKVTL
jgi:hypothetical protein